MAPTCSNCRRLRPHKKSRRVAKAAFEFRRCRAQDGVPKRPAAPFAKRRGPIFGDNFRAVAQHCLPCNSGARRLHNGSPHREARTILPRSHHCQYRAILFPCGGPDFRLAGAHQATYPNAPPKWRRPTSPLTNLRHRQRRARRCEGEAGARSSGPIVRGSGPKPPPERRTFKSERPAAIRIPQIAWNDRTIRHKSKNR